MISRSESPSECENVKVWRDEKLYRSIALYLRLGSEHRTLNSLGNAGQRVWAIPNILSQRRSRTSSKVLSRKSLHSVSSLLAFRPSDIEVYLCANQALVTAEIFSLILGKRYGLSTIATTAFWTVDRVTSAGRWISSLASSWRVQDMPNKDVAGCDFVCARRSVK